MVQAIYTRDCPIVQATVMIVALIFVLIGDGVASIDRFRTCWWVLGAFCAFAAVTTLGLGPPKFNRGVLIQTDPVPARVLRD